MQQIKQLIKQLEKKQLFQIIEQNPTSVAITGKEGKIEYVNSKFEELTGYQIADVIGEDFSVLKSQKHSDSFYKNLWTTIKSGEIWQGEIYNLKQDETGYWEQVIIYPILNSKAEIINYVKFAQDITDEKQLKNELDKSNQKLECINQVVEKTYQQLADEMEKARLLHEQFLPSEFPKLKELSFGSFYQPAKKLGGDFYNIIKIGNKLLFYIVDIMGHGLDGAILNVFIRESINSFVFANHNSSGKITPKKLIAFIYQKFCEESFPEDYFISLIMGTLNVTTMEFSFSNAGIQIPPLLINENGQIKDLIAPGFPISKCVESCDLLMKNIEEKKIKLAPGDTILLATDGLIEDAIIDNEMYGLKRVKNSIKHNYFLSPQLIINGIINDYKELKTITKSSDDITLFALQYKSAREDDFYRKVKSDYSSWEKVIIEAENFLKQYFAEIDFMMIGLREIICNAIEHGNQKDSNKNVELRINIYYDHVCITVVDDGDGFDWQQKLAEDFDYQGKNDRGRGVYLTQMAFDYLYYNPAGNKAVMVKIKQGGS